MITFGADPSLPSKDAQEDEAKLYRTTVRPRRVINELINHFGYHKGMRMNQRFNETDRGIIGHRISVLLKRGMTSDSIKQMIDLFYASPHSASGFPALTFTKHEVQEELISKIDMVESVDCINWLIDGMPDDGPVANSAEMRKAVLLHADDMLYRYPEVVADIIQLDYTYAETCDLLQQLNDVVAWKLRYTDEVPDISQLARLINLPAELTPNKRLKSHRVRRKSNSIRHAFVSAPQKRKGEW